MSEQKMSAIGYEKGSSGQGPQALFEAQIAVPSPGPRDLLVKVEAISINPVDTKARQRGLVLGEPLNVPGWDVSGKVVSVGENVKAFKTGDEVYYAGSIHRPGANSTYHCVDERIVATKPQTLSPVQAAAMPLTSLTAWEALFERLGLKLGETKRYQNRSLLVIGGAGGVGSMAIQLAKKLVGLEVIATASREESRNWCEKMGADHTVDHRGDLIQAFDQKGLRRPDYILCAANTDPYFSLMAELIQPQGRICAIVEPAEKHDIGLLMQKSVSFSFELMFTRSLFETEDMEQQGKILEQVAQLVDESKIRTTATKHLGPISLENIRIGHQMLETGSTIGKIVLG